MKQLGNQDAGFIYAETTSTPMHIAGLGIYDQSTAPGGRLGHKDIIKYVQDRIHFAPIFRQKLVEVPFGIDKPYWIDDPDFDIEFHIRHIALPHPGDWRQLCILVSRLNSRPLDFSRPLWEAYVIEGLDNVDGLPKGSFAIFVKVHHSCVDGASGQGVFGALHDLSRDAQPSAPSAPLLADRTPTTVELLSRSVGNNLKRSLSRTKSIYKFVPTLLKEAIKLYSGNLQSGTKLKVPHTRFNKNLTPHRVFEGTHFSLDEVKQIKNVVDGGTTVNDVMVTIVGGALRKYLAHHGELPGESLTAMLPQDIRTDANRKEFGNQVGGLFADLHSDIEDPVKRLLAVHESTVLAKAFANEVNTAALVQNFMGGFMNPVLGKNLNRLLYSTHLLESLGPMVANTLITNVPGPNFPLYHAGAEMVAYWGLPPLVPMIGIGHAVFSYCGRISLSVTSCRQMMPDPHFYIQCCEEAFIELLAAAKILETKRLEEQKLAELSEKTEALAKKTDALIEAVAADVAQSPDTEPETTKPEAKESQASAPQAIAPKETAAQKPAKAKAKKPRSKKASTAKAKDQEQLDFSDKQSSGNSVNKSKANGQAKKPKPVASGDTAH